MAEAEFIPCPFERQIVGPQGAILLRRNLAHAADCVTAIRRRAHPRWSRFVCGFRIAEREGAAA